MKSFSTSGCKDVLNLAQILGGGCSYCRSAKGSLICAEHCRSTALCHNHCTNNNKETLFCWDLGILGFFFTLYLQKKRKAGKSFFFSTHYTHKFHI